MYRNISYPFKEKFIHSNTQIQQPYNLPLQQGKELSHSEDIHGLYHT